MIDLVFNKISSIKSGFIILIIWYPNNKSSLYIVYISKKKIKKIRTFRKNVCFEINFKT